MKDLYCLAVSMRAFRSARLERPREVKVTSVISVTIQLSDPWTEYD